MLCFWASSLDIQVHLFNREMKKGSKCKNIGEKHAVCVVDDFDKIPKEIKYENTRKDTKKFTIHVNRKHKTCMAVFKSIANM